MYTTVNKPVRIAIQSSGRLKEPSLDFIRSLGLEFNQEDTRALVLACRNANIELVFVRHSDIPGYVARGTVDFGIVGSNLAYERDMPVSVVKELGFGLCRLMIAVPNDSEISTVTDLNGKRIATSYPVSLLKFLKTSRITASTVEMGGSVEAAPSLGLADAICDITQTGGTLKANGLRELVAVLSSEAIFIESPAPNERKTLFNERFMEARV